MAVPMRLAAQSADTQGANEWQGAAPTPFGAQAPSLGGVLDSDGQIRPATEGSFSGAGFQVAYEKNGAPRFTAMADGWQEGFGNPGLNSSVSAIAVVGSDVYVGGGFTNAGGVAADRIARWDGSQWHALGAGVNSSVSAIAVAGSDVYVGGSFSETGDGTLVMSNFGHYITSGSSAPLTITATTPAANANNVARDATITATFSADVDQGTVSASTFTVRGSQRGDYDGAFTFPAANQLRFDPTQDFLPGEVITITAHAGVQSTDGTALASQTWAFTAAAGTGTGFFGAKQVITATADGVTGLQAADVNGDGHVDLLSSTNPGSAIEWYENDGASSFTLRVVADPVSAANAVFAADVDGDGDMDAVSAATTDEVVWYENDGSENFTARLITSSALNAQGVTAADLDADGDVDVITASFQDRDFAWYENNGSQGFTQRFIDANASGPRHAQAADVDGDGDLDVLVVMSATDQFRWYINDGNQSFTRAVIAHGASVRGFYPIDMDSDGDLDIVASSLPSGNHRVLWYENNGDLSFTPHTIANVGTNASPSGIYAGDLDGDSDIDVAAVLENDDTVVWYENTGGQSFTEHVLATDVDNARRIVAADLDGDADLDIVVASATDDTIAWFEQTIPPFTITAVTPTANDLDASLTANISATFAADVNQGTVNASTFTVHGSQRGIYAGAFSFPANDQVSFDPTLAFLPGEVITVTATGSIQSSGEALAPQTWSFTATSGMGTGAFGVPQAITTTADAARAVHAADMDGDGDVDVLSASSSDNRIVWYVNDGGGSFGTEHVISSTATNTRFVYADDINGDGTMDLLAAYDNTVAWYTNNGGGSFTEQVLSTSPSEAKSMHAADVDSDGDLDVVVADRSSGLRWYANGDGASPTFTEHIIPETAVFPVSAHAADVDGDGDVDVVLASDFSPAGQAGVSWYENDGEEMFTEHIIARTNGADDVYTADVDGDGDLDILVASRFNAEVAWYANNGTGTFVAAQVIASSALSTDIVLHAADVDGDGDLDMLSASTSDDTIAWYENNGSQVFTKRVVTTGADGATSVYTADVDGDGDLDILSASGADDTIAWYEQTAPAFTITAVTPTANALAVARDATLAATFDADVDPSTVSASTFTVRGSQRGDYAGTFSFPSTTQLRFESTQDFLPGEVITVTATSGLQSSSSAALTSQSWAFRAAPSAGPGTFGRHQVVTSDADGIYSVYAADVDGDGDLDLLSASFRDNKVAWYENDGSQGFTEHVVTTNADAAASVYAADVDGDGDLDVLSASFRDNKIAWYENDGSEGFTEHVVTTNATVARSVYAADVDGDGDLDVLSASFTDDKIAWYENDGSEGFTERVVTTHADGATAVYAADVDGDGDLDVLSASGLDDTIAWYENDGNEGFTEHVQASFARNAHSVYAADVDGDGDLDILAAWETDDEVAWYEQTLPKATISGDAGWRMLAAPAAGFTPAGLADDTALQGISGGDNEGSPPNLFTRPSSETWTAPASTTTAFTPGLGFILYVYDNTLAGSTELPIILDATGLPPTADVSVALADGGFTLLGNPFARSIALDQLTGNGTGGTGSGLVSPIQVWDDGTGSPDWRDPASASGSFVPFNLGENHVIAPWQGFMLQSADATQATIPLAARTGIAPTIEVFQRPTEDSLAVPMDDPAFRRIAFELEGPAGSGALDRSAQLYFHSAAHTGRDGYDGQKLVPLLGQYATLAFVAPYDAEQLLVQDARSLNPVDAEVYELAVSIAGLSGAFTLRWPEMVDIPDGWRIELRDRVTGTIVDLRQSAQYVFESDPTTAAASKLGAGPRMRAQSVGETASRFELAVLSDAVRTGVDELFEVPDRVELLQNYPNPFNPSTTLGFRLPVSSAVQLALYNALGQRVAVVADGVYGAGQHEVVWEAGGLPSGVYVYRLQVGDQVQTRMLTLVR
ncbi:MAG: hypothetical protein RhofKO_41740 [Rhodothermales bacterium]